MHDFFALPLTSLNSAHFNKHIDWIETKFGDDHPLHLLLKGDENWIRILSESSNAIRHPEAGQTIEIRNIELKPGNKFSVPSWKYNLEKKSLGKLNEFVDLVTDLDNYAHNLMGLLEELLLWSLDELFKNSELLGLASVPNEMVNLDCPIHYYVVLKKSI